MDKVSVFYDTVGNTLTVWFGDRKEEIISEETGEEMILMKNNQGEVIGFEKLNFRPESHKDIPVSFETVTV
jgi:uncharacterized protein YuzE